MSSFTLFRLSIGCGSKISESSRAMSCSETLLPLNPIDYFLPSSLGSCVSVHDSHFWPCIALNPLTHCMTNPLYNDSPSKNWEEEVIYPSLPPLLIGHSDVHIRNGIMNALRMAAAQVPDAEKAFFVADLSQIYQQHKRWRACLPEIIPFYGAHAPCFSRTLII